MKALVIGATGSTGQVFVDEILKNDMIIHPLPFLLESQQEKSTLNL